MSTETEFKTEEELFIAAGKGNAEAQFRLAELITIGLTSKSTKPDPENARKWFLLAAKQGHPKAQFELAGMLEKGEGGPPLPNEAEHWYEQARKGGLMHPDYVKNMLHNNTFKKDKKDVKEKSAAAILVIDDNKMQQKLIAGILERMNYKVRLASSGKKGLEIFKQDASIKLVIIDQMMPEMDGVTCLRKLRSLSDGGSIPALMISGSSDPEKVVAARKAGIIGWLVKPINRKVLEKELKKAFPK